MADTPIPIAEIDHGPGKLEQFLDNHQKKLIIVAVFISLGIVGYVIWAGIEEAEQNDAGAALVKADEIADYKDVISQYPGSAAAASSMPLLANMQWQDSQPDGLQTLQDFIDQHPEHPVIHTANVSLGLRLLEQGKVNEAKAKLTEIAENHPNSYLNPLACIALGDIAKSKKEIAEATNWYEKAKENEARNNAFLEMASARLAIVNAQPPVKIKPAPPKPPTPPIAPATSDKAASAADQKAKANGEASQKAPNGATEKPSEKNPENSQESKKNSIKPAPPAQTDKKPEPTL
ncbi:MAG: tetratricopeptide repeat protein [Akkermansiaceae bacterium]|jgi:predicted negative regulator of RcsB-dependent stress response|nr:tetratricopeptide repeat protein [Akkermansiaceae bacterium]